MSAAAGSGGRRSVQVYEEPLDKGNCEDSDEMLANESSNPGAGGSSGAAGSGGAGGPGSFDAGALVENEEEAILIAPGSIRRRARR
jgi:hypothetical protein